MQGQGGFDEAQHFEDIFAQFFGGGGFGRGGGGGTFRGGFGGFEGFRAKGPDLQARIRCAGCIPLVPLGPQRGALKLILWPCAHA